MGYECLADLELLGVRASRRSETHKLGDVVVCLLKQRRKCECDLIILIGRSVFVRNDAV